MKALIIIVLCIVSYNVHSHQVTTGYLNLSKDEANNYAGYYKIALHDLQSYINFDSNKDNKISWQEIIDTEADVHTFIKSNIQLTQTARACLLSFPSQLMLNSNANHAYLHIPVRFDCSPDTGVILNYTAFFSYDLDHKAIVTVNNNKQVYSYKTEQLAL